MVNYGQLWLTMALMVDISPTRTSAKEPKVAPMGLIHLEASQGVVGVCVSSAGIR